MYPTLALPRVPRERGPGLLGHPAPLALAVQGVPGLAPFVARFRGGNVLHRDQLARRKRALAADPGRPQPGLRGHAVLVLTEHCLELGRRAAEGRRCWTGDHRDRLRGVARTLGEDADAVKLGICWVFG